MTGQVKEEQGKSFQTRGSNSARGYLSRHHGSSSLNQNTLARQNLNWIEIQGLEIRDPGLVNPRFAITRIEGREVLLFRCEHLAFPRGQFLSGVVESVENLKGSPQALMKKLLTTENIDLKLENSSSQLRLKNPSEETAINHDKDLGFKCSRWQYVGLFKRGVNVDDIDSNSLASDLGLRKGDVILGAVFKDSKGAVKQILFETKTDFDAFLQLARFFPKDHRSISFIVKKPEEGREEVLEKLKKGDKNVLTDSFEYSEKKGRFVEVKE
jgi:hypothetical protein